MISFKDLEKYKKKTALQDDKEKNGDPMSNKKLIIGGIVFVGVMIGGWIIYKKVIVKSSNPGMAAAGSAGNMGGTNMNNMGGNTSGGGFKSADFE